MPARQYSHGILAVNNVAYSNAAHYEDIGMLAYPNVASPRRAALASGGPRGADSYVCAIALSEENQFRLGRHSHLEMGAT